MHILVNGEERTVTAMSVLAFLASLGIDPQRVAVELNLDILPKNAYGETQLKEGDRLEIVHFVGGGQTASEKVHLRRCASSCVPAAYLPVRLTPRTCAPCSWSFLLCRYILATFYVSNGDSYGKCK